MAGATTITIVGSLGGDPDTRSVGNSQVANFSVAVSERVFNRETSEWEDKGTSWFPCSAWKDLGEHVATSLHKGDRVVVTGSWKERTYEKDGETRRAWQLDVEDIGPSLRYATAIVTKAGGGNRNQQARQQQARQQPAAAAQPAAQQMWAQPSVYDDNTPF